MSLFSPTTTLQAWTIPFLLLSTLSSPGQSQWSANSAPVEGDYAVVQAGPHSRIWQNSSGQSVTEIATGMNYNNGGQWIPSNPSFVVSPDGTTFAASQIQDPTRLAANLNGVGAVTVTTPDNVTLSSTPLAIGLYDPVSGLSAMVATLTNSTGILADAQDIVYSRALVGGGFAASVVYSLPDTASFHQDVVFVAFDHGFNPTNYGFAESSTNSLQIQIITEFYDPPQPEMITNYIYVEENPAIRAGMASPDIIDYTLDFGDYVFGPGQAYTSSTNTGPGKGVRVVKDFVTSNERTFLIESVSFLSLAAGLWGLPPIATNTASLTPSWPRAQRKRLAAVPVAPFRETKSGTMAKAAPGEVAALKPHGVTIDYVATVSSTTKPVIYAADTTYFVSGNVVDSSTVTMESAVFKYPKGLTGQLLLEGAIIMATTNYRPAFFTAADDNTIGTALSTNIWSGYSGIPGTNRYGNEALVLGVSANVALNNIRFSYQNCAILMEPNNDNVSLSVSHAQFVNCAVGIDEDDEITDDGTPFPLNVNNCLWGNVSNPLKTEYGVLVGNACNCTIDSCANLLEAGSSESGSTFDFTNCILSSVASEGALGPLVLNGSYNGFYISPAFGSHQFTNTYSPYETVGAGNYYLPSTSSFLTAGTTNIAAALLSQLQIKTTEAPLLLTNVFTNNTTLTPLAQRDTAGTALGWHYDSIDYVAACAVSNAILLLTNGVALAYYDNLGVWLQDGSQLVSQGAPNYLNYLVYYGLAQEQPTNLWTTNTAVAQSLPIASCPYHSANAPSIYLRMTTLCAPQGETNLMNTGDSNQVISNLTLRDCEVYGSGANWIMSESNNTPWVGLTNNVLFRVPFAVSNNATMLCYNNLFYGTTNTNSFAVSLRHRAGGLSPNANENNVFDGVTAMLDGTVGYNAYLHGATNSTIQGTDIVTNLTWQAGPLGAYYQATTSPLLNNGSTYATNLGLYHYTVGTNEVVESTNVVSRGYHYIALGTNGLPLDFNNDGIPDYLEDANGNGAVNSGEIDWLVAGDLGLIVTITQPQPNSTIP